LTFPAISARVTLEFLFFVCYLNRQKQNQVESEIASMRLCMGKGYSQAGFSIVVMEEQWQ